MAAQTLPTEVDVPATLARAMLTRADTAARRIVLRPIGRYLHLVAPLDLALDLASLWAEAPRRDAMSADVENALLWDVFVRVCGAHAHEMRDLLLGAMPRAPRRSFYMVPEARRWLVVHMDDDA